MMLETATIANASSVVASADYDIKVRDKEVVTIWAGWASTSATFSLQLQYSLDGTTYINDGSAQAISDNSGNKVWEPAIVAPFYRVASTRTSGTLTSLKIMAVMAPF
jgi:hypothetical protein